ncbi:LAME_0F02212g1_1 [Lachancea meyersii CBS 8951]|uniref:LAME_0F02212g1_1 n=1 Tax=Lachancea meyersii CBS 8951 TaxID=1266667 RepID=A0A1G4JQE5_9SACH|nr:LAME_0F02212g1_1 [Lachancea meyersii CBS 8951]
MECPPFGLPKEIWLTIFEYLDTIDLLRFRACSHEFNELVKTPYIWMSRCRARWVKIEEGDFLAGQLSLPLRGPSKDDWFYYYRYRNRMDEHIMNSLSGIAECGKLELETYGDCMNRCLKYAAFSIPLLRSLELEGYTEQRPFDITFLARQLLLMMRHKCFFEFIDRSLAPEANEWVHHAEESVFLPLGTMDLAFNRLLPHRTKIFNQVHSQLKENFPDISQFMQLPDTLRIDKIMKYLFLALNEARSDRPLQRPRHFLDDFMLLRVYAGEAKGHPIVLLAIIQEVSSFYDVETVLCEEFLIVRDARIRTGETYVTISPAGSPRIFTRKNLVDSLCRIFPSRQAVLSSVIPKMLQPVRTQDLLTKLFDEWSPHCKKSYWDMVPEKNIESLRSLMPYSKHPPRCSDYEYYQAYWKLKSSSIQEQFRRLGENHFIHFVKSRYPHDNLFMHASFEQIGNDSSGLSGPRSLDPLFEKYSVSKTLSSLVGSVVRDKRTDAHFILVSTKSAEGGSQYVSLLDPFGDICILLREDIKMAKPQEIDDAVLAELMHSLSLTELGLFFTKFDRHSNRFIPSRMFSSYLAD